MSPNNPIDTDTYSMLHELMGDEEFTEIVDFFRMDTQQAISNINTAIRDNNAEMINIICHKLKSSCRLIGANDLADMADSLEKQKAGLSADAPIIASNMQTQFDHIIAWLDTETVTA